MTDGSTKCTWRKFCFKVLQILIILGWLGMIPVGIFKGLHFFDDTADKLKPADGSQSELTERLVEKLGSDVPYRSSNFITLFIETTDGSQVIADGLIPQLFNETYVKIKSTEFGGSVGGAFWYGANFPAFPPSDLLKSQLISPSGEATQMIINFSWYFMVPTFSSLLRDGVNAALQDKKYAGRYEAHVSSYIELNLAGSGAATDDLAQMDMISVPVAFVVLALKVGSLQLLLLPLICIVCSLLTSFAILVHLSDNTGTVFPSFAPAMFISTTLALGFDWSLFLLVRFRQGLDAGLSSEQAIKNVIVKTGRTVLMSGVTIIISYAALAVFPVDFISAIGKGASVCLTMTLLCNLTLLPALLLLYPPLWRADLSWQRLFTCKKWESTTMKATTQLHIRRGMLPAVGPPITGQTAGSSSAVEEDTGAYKPLGEENDRTAGSTLTLQSVVHELAQEEMHKSFWFGIVKRVENRPLAVIVCLVLLFSPFTYLTTTFRYTINANQINSRNSLAYREHMKLTHSGLPMGYSDPYVVLAQKLDSTMSADAYFQLQTDMLQECSRRTGLPPAQFYGPSWFNGVSVNVTTAQAYMNAGPTPPKSPLYDTPLGQLYRLRVVSNRLYDSDTNPTLLGTEVDTVFDPTGEYALDFVREARAVVKEYNEAQSQVQFYFGLADSDMYDVVTDIFHLFPFIILAVMGILFVFIIFAFRSIVVALRLLFTLACTLSWTYGAGVLVFQTGAFDFVGSAIEDIRAFYWMGPVLTLSLNIGLAMDYDIFLMDRIREYRLKGYTDAAAVKMGVYHTGSVITTAGLIMIIAFGSLILSKQMLLVQVGFLLCFSVFVDTFIVRPVLVPALMFSLGKYNFWPYKMPVGLRDESSPDDDSHSCSIGAEEGGGEGRESVDSDRSDVEILARSRDL